MNMCKAWNRRKSYALRQGLFLNSRKWMRDFKDTLNLQWLQQIYLCNYGIFDHCIGRSQINFHLCNYPNANRICCFMQKSPPKRWVHKFHRITGTLNLKCISLYLSCRLFNSTTRNSDKKFPSVIDESTSSIATKKSLNWIKAAKFFFSLSGCEGFVFSRNWNNSWNINCWAQFFLAGCRESFGNRLMWLEWIIDKS